MFGRKCTLCGGKLDRRGICTECGLDNNKSEKNYHVNQSSCDNMPMTHVHEDEKKPSYVKKNTQDRQAQKVQKKKKSKRPRIIAFAMLIIIAGMIIFSVVSYLMQTVLFDSDDSYYTDYEYDPYASLDKENPESGDEAEYELSSGTYIVGLHIPAGDYKAVVQYDFDAVQVSDYENGIYLYEYAGQDEENYLDDLRLFDHAILTISSETSVTLKTENAQPLSVNGIANPVIDSYEITDSRIRTAGVDFAAGIYDLELLEGTGAINLVIYAEDGNEYSYESIYLGEDQSDGKEYKYMVIPENTQITCEEGMRLIMTPSETIESTDYLGFYTRY